MISRSDRSACPEDLSDRSDRSDRIARRSGPRRMLSSAQLTVSVTQSSSQSQDPPTATAATTPTPTPATTTTTTECDKCRAPDWSRRGDSQPRRDSLPINTNKHKERHFQRHFASCVAVYYCSPKRERAPRREPLTRLALRSRDLRAAGVFPVEPAPASQIRIGRSVRRLQPRR